MGEHYLHSPDANAIFLHIDLLFNGTCSVTGGGGGGGVHNLLGERVGVNSISRDSPITNITI